jgi:hypothetical protein
VLGHLVVAAVLVVVLAAVQPGSPPRLEVAGDALPAGADGGTGAPAGGGAVSDALGLGPDGANERTPADTFERDQVASFVDPYRWRIEAGTWEVRNGAAVPTAAGPDDVAIAVFDAAGTAGAVTVDLSQVAIGAGIVVRYAGPRNYVAFIRQNGFFAHYELVEVVDGERRDASTGSLGVESGQASFGLLLDGTHATLVIEGAVALDDAGEPRRAAIPAVPSTVGMIATGDAIGVARFDRFRFEPAD